MNIQRVRAADGAGLGRRVIGDLAGVDAIAADWRALEVRSAGTLGYFQSFGWCRAWLAAFAPPGSGIVPSIETFWASGRLVAVLPLVRRSGAGGLVRLESLGTPHGQYMTMLVEPAFCDRAGEALLRPLLERFAGTVDVAIFSAVPEGSPLATLLAGAERLGGAKNESSILDLTVFETAAAYAASLSKTQRRNRNRRRNQLAREGELAFSVVWPGDEDFVPLVHRCVAMKRRWLKETGRVSLGFAYRDFEGFLASLEGDARRMEGACLFALTAGGRLVAAEIGFLQKGHYYAYIGAFDWDLRQVSPGKTQMDMTVCWLIDRGVERYDLLGNPADYKESWSDRTVRLETFALPLTWKGRLYARFWIPRLRPALKRLFERLPEGLRRLASVGQTMGMLLVVV
ncbi:GNAT family N-acetyltransferase [Rhizobium sp. TRM95111]|uniref:GNAT family N-acetyltransferase n=1 Tax=Rhizobium alarense TaxID=2846851 RepID=UPI001F1B0CF3|nr:GNAT family N-acetyltransferase [Rhizobium alarense]MCF3638596.1 GNAT family N-acetyltransferase [Rhizobium alarense]